VLQCVAVRCNVLQCVAALESPRSAPKKVCCSLLRCAAVRCSVSQCFGESVLQCEKVHAALPEKRVAVCCSAGCCSVLQVVAVCCSVLQCIAMCCSVRKSAQHSQESVLQSVAVCCSAMQCFALFW